MDTESLLLPADAALDPVTAEVVTCMLTSICDEMAVALERAAYSPMIRDVRDYCSALVDVRGRVLAYNTGGLPTHFGDLGDHVLDGLAVYGPNGFAPGDAVMMNAAFVCGQHANNVLVYVPIFYENELVAFAATRAHWQDIGGITANRPVFGTTEAVQEGLQVRSVKVYSGGVSVPDVLRLIEGNLRRPDISLGDLRAQIGAAKVGERRMVEMLSRYRMSEISMAVEAIWSQSARLAREAVRRIPDGIYSAKSLLDDDGFEVGRRIEIRVGVTVDGDTFHVDLTELPDQVRGPINSRSLAPVYIAFKALTTPHRPPDPGCFEPLSVTLPDGKLISARAPAAMGSWSWPFPTIIDTIFHALAHAIPERVAAGNSGMAYGAGFFYGTEPQSGRTFVSSDILPVGWGARHDSAGPTSGGMTLGYVRDCPIEITEALYPLRVRRYELRRESGGDGRYRGGDGVEREYELLVDAFNNGEIARVSCPGWGLHGGSDGAPAFNTIVAPDGDAEDIHHSYMNRLLAAGTRVIVRTGGGGGWGDIANGADRQTDR